MKISTSISVMGACLAVASAVVLVGVVIVQKHSLRSQLSDTIDLQAVSEATKTAQNTYLMCSGMEVRNQHQLTHSLRVARDLVAAKGGAHQSSDTVEWQAVNQLSKESTKLTLPKFLIGADWLGQVTGANQPAAIVDDATSATGDYCTIFQRINEAGDMLRVCTSVTNESGARAVGTFIPSKNADGQDNPIIQSVLRGVTYNGRAWVVNQWHAAAYEPIWDAGKQRVIGMLYVGIGMKQVNQELHDSIMRMVVGKSGYVFVLGGKGDQKGHYIVSEKGQRDGEVILDLKDANGSLFVQSIINHGMTNKAGSVSVERYSWKGQANSNARAKFAALTYFEPWDWIIGGRLLRRRLQRCDTPDRLRSATNAQVGCRCGRTGGFALAGDQPLGLSRHHKAHHQKH